MEEAAQGGGLRHKKRASMAVNETRLEQTSLKDYGETIAVYVGQGALTLNDGRKVSCKFEAGQLSHGEVLLLCDIEPLDLSLCFMTISSDWF